MWHKSPKIIHTKQHITQTGKQKTAGPNYLWLQDRPLSKKSFQNDFRHDPFWILRVSILIFGIVKQGFTNGIPRVPPQTHERPSQKPWDHTATTAPLYSVMNLLSANLINDKNSMANHLLPSRKADHIMEETFIVNFYNGTKIVMVIIIVSIHIQVKQILSLGTGVREGTCWKVFFNACKVAFREMPL